MVFRIISSSNLHIMLEVAKEAIFRLKIAIIKEMVVLVLVS